ncbi:MAG: DUF1634 domain-containing protein [Desulfurococcales archaeon]|jgi:uncharacterized membrane protein
MGQKSLEKSVYMILRFSVMLSLMLTIAGLIVLFIRGPTMGLIRDSSGLRFGGLSIGRAVEKIVSGDPLGILWISIITLIGGVIASIAVSAFRTYRSRDKPLAIVSIILIVIVVLSAFIGIFVRSLH